MISPTQRTLRALEQRGCICGIVERFNPFAGKFGKRHDLFNIFDIVAIYPTGICGVQSCGQSYSAHYQKIISNDIGIEWIKAGGIIELFGWRKVVKKRGSKLRVWQPRIHRFSLEDFK